MELIELKENELLHFNGGGDGEDVGYAIGYIIGLAVGSLLVGAHALTHEIASK